MTTVDPQTARRQDFERLYTTFYTAFDRSSILQQLRNHYEQKHPLPFLGGGRHFQVFQLEHKLSRLAVAIPEDDFLAQYNVGGDRWVTRLEKLHGKSVPLVPPFEVINDQDKPHIIMPYGPDALSSAAAQWQPIEPFVQEFVKGLEQLDLKLMDQIQGRCYDGVPFIFDFSDLASC